jgi:hypothetical protein
MKSAHIIYYPCSGGELEAFNDFQTSSHARVL